MVKARKAATKKSVKKTVKKTGTRRAAANKPATLAGVSAEVGRVKDSLVKSGEKLVDTVSKQVSQTKKKLDRAIAKQKSAKNRRVAANKRMKANLSAATEQALEAAKAVYDSALAEASALRREYDAGKDQLRLLKEESAKASALAKTIDTFEKKWEAKVAKARKKAGAKKRGRPSKKAAKKA